MSYDHRSRPLMTDAQKIFLSDKPHLKPLCNLIQPRRDGGVEIPYPLDVLVADLQSKDDHPLGPYILTPEAMLHTITYHFQLPGKNEFNQQQSGSDYLHQDAYIDSVRELAMDNAGIARCPFCQAECSVNVGKNTCPECDFDFYCVWDKTQTPRPPHKWVVLVYQYDGINHRKSMITEGIDETHCHYCGKPMLKGDKSIELNGELFCSIFCLKAEYPKATFVPEEYSQMGYEKSSLL